MRGKRILLFLFVLSVLSLMTYQSNRKPLLPFSSLSAPLNVFYTVKDAVARLVKAPFETLLLREEENKRLVAELAELRREQQVCQEALRENERLRSLLALKEREPRFVTSARVIARGTDQWAHTFILDKGRSDGVQKEMTAITEKGLVGKISSADSSYAKLLLLTDINFSAAARLQESRTEGIVSGTGFRTCQLKYIPYDEELHEGDVVITSGLDSLFPEGIPIGFISKVSKRESGLFPYVEVTPFNDNAKTEIVLIIQRS